MSQASEISSRATALAVLQKHVGGCREWVEGKANYCFEPAEYVLWGKLIPPEGLGPRCFLHAREHVSDYGTRRRSNYALINLHDLADDLKEATDA